MDLTEINKKDIINYYGSLKHFNEEIDKAKAFISKEDKLILQNIQIYYTNVFETEVIMAEDVSELQDIALYNASRLKKLYKNKKLFIYQFLYRRILSNLNYISNVRMLA